MPEDVLSATARNEEMMTSRTTRIRPALFVQLFGSAVFAVLLVSESGAETPSNRELIAAMPPGTESVIVQRHSLLRSDESVFRDDYRGGPQLHRTKHFRSAVENAIRRAVPVVFACGGSDFAIPPTSGMTGTFNERAITVVEQPLNDLIKHLQNGNGNEQFNGRFDVDGVTVFEGTTPNIGIYGGTRESSPEPWFVAIPNVTTVVTAESREDIQYMLASLKGKKTEVPSRWRSIARDHDLESPIVILRKFPHVQKETPGGKRLALPPPEIKLEQLALTLTDVRSAILRISIASGNPADAVLYYEGFFHGSLYLWDVRTDSTGANGTIAPREKGTKPENLMLQLFVLFGPYPMI